MCGWPGQTSALDDVRVAESGVVQYGDPVLKGFGPSIGPCKVSAVYDIVKLLWVNGW